MDGGLSKNDPNREVIESAQKGVRPGFLGGEGGGSAPAGLKPSSGRNGAKSELSDAEKNAASGGEDGGFYNKDDSLDSARENEEKADGLYSGKGIGGKGKDGKKKKGGFFKKKGPLISIFLMILGVGGIAGSTQSFQLFSWVANANLDFGQSSAVLNRRTNFVIKDMFKSDGLTKRTFFGSEKYTIGKSMTKKLKANNIDVVDTTGTDGKKLKLLVYTDADGNKVPIAASEKDKARIPTSYKDNDVGDITFSSEHHTLDTAKKSLDGFEVDLDKSTESLTSKIAGWFDSLAEKFLNRVAGEDARNKLNKLNNDSSEEEVEATIYKNASGGSENGDTTNVREEVIDEKGDVQIGDDGKPVTKNVDQNTEYGSGDLYDKKGNKTGTYESGGDDSLKPSAEKPSNKEVQSKLSTIMSKAVMGANVACMILRGFGAISATIAAIQVANVINYTMSIMEASDKVRAGDGNESFHKIANSLNTRVTTTAYDENGNEVESYGATTESDGWNTTFSNKNLVSGKEPGALMVNREYATKNALNNTDWGAKDIAGDFMSIAGNIGNSVAAFQICNGIQMAMGAVDAISDVILMVSTFGAGKPIKEFFKGIIKASLKGIVMAAAGVAIAIIAPMVGQWLAGNLKSVFLGQTGGYALNSGAHMVHNGNLQMSAGMNANKDQAVELYAMTREVQQEWMAYDRATLSPFDVTSKYTFLGSLANSIIPLVNTSKTSLTSFTSSSINLVGSSIAALSGNTVTAANDINDFKLSLFEGDNCPALAGMELAGDAYCNRYSGAYMNDLTTMSSEEIYEKISDNFDDNGIDSNPKIKEDSDLAKYIVACNTNDAQPGTMSAVVQTFIQEAKNTVTGGSVIGNSLIDIGSGFIPMSGIVDAVDAAEDQANIKWNSQQVCSDPQYRYFSDYSVDQRVLEGLGVIDKSAVSVFLDDYYEKNPLDNSYEGILARYSGLTKEEVTDTLATLEYIDYVANYKPSERYAFGAPVVEGQRLLFDSEPSMETEGVLLGEVVYADVRNRSFAI